MKNYLLVCGLIGMFVAPGLVSANSGSLGDQIRDLVRERIDEKQQEVCARFDDRVRSKHPWVKGPSFCRETPGEVLPTVSLSATPLSVVVGGSSTLNWSSTNADFCSASGGWSGTKNTSGNQLVTVSATTTYSLACGNEVGTTTTTVTVNATPTPPAPTPTVDINATPLSVMVGSTSTLSWTSQNALACTASATWGGAGKSLSGSEVVVVSATTTYSISCGNGMATTTDSVTVNATPVPQAPTPSVDLTASPLVVASGGTTTLAWTSSASNVCTASNGWSGAKGLSGSEVATVTQMTTYTITCGNGTATTTDSVVVNVLPTLTFSATPLQIIAGATTTLSWNSSFTTSCTASGGWTGARSLSGSEIVTPSATTTYTLTCNGVGGMVLQSVTVGVTPTPVAMIGHVVISEVYYDVGFGKGDEPANEWMELYNGSSSPIDINGWKVQDESGSFDVLATTSTMVPAGGRLIVTASSTTANFWTLMSPAVVLGTSIGNGLGNTVDSLVLMDSASTTIDAVSWGVATTTTVMVPPVPAVSTTTKSIGRLQLTSDTNTNVDWGEMTPTPGN